MALGSRLIYLRSAQSGGALAEAARRFGAQGVLFNHLYDPISMVRDNEVKAELSAAGLLCQSFNGDVLREPWEVLAANGRPWTCFDEFWNAHVSLPYAPPPPLPIPAVLPLVSATITGLPVQELGLMLPEEELSNQQLEFHWGPGSAGGHTFLQDFILHRLPSFDSDKAKTDRNSTSKLSPYIHFGEVSVRHVYHAVKAMALEWARRGQSTEALDAFLRQLGFREYSRYLSFHFPFTHERSLLEHLRAVPWRFDQRMFKAWRQGNTGYPLVDAGMRELWSTGWMHNRLRVVCASFLVKNLLLPWQWGLKHYWDALLDADLECDALGWQYVAGCLADAHEFSYIIDHATEAKKFDPDGNYIRRWLPVLARVPTAYIHRPWEAPESLLDDAGVELGSNYPFPVISVEESKMTLKAATEVIDRAAAKSASFGAPSTARGPFRPATDPNPSIPEGSPWPEPYRSTARGAIRPPVRQQSCEHVRIGQGGASDDAYSEGVESNALGTTVVTNGGAPPSRRPAVYSRAQVSNANGQSCSGVTTPGAAGNNVSSHERMAMATPIPALCEEKNQDTIGGGSRNGGTGGTGRASSTCAVVLSVSQLDNAKGRSNMEVDRPLLQRDSPTPSAPHVGIKRPRKSPSPPPLK